MTKTQKRLDEIKSWAKKANPAELVLYSNSYIPNLVKALRVAIGVLSEKEYAGRCFHEALTQIEQIMGGGE